jgi:hypothetical protein
LPIFRIEVEQGSLTVFWLELLTDEKTRLSFEVEIIQELEKFGFVVTLTGIVTPVLQLVFPRLSTFTITKSFLPLLVVVLPVKRMVFPLLQAMGVVVLSMSSTAAVPYDFAHNKFPVLLTAIMKKFLFTAPGMYPTSA